MFRSCFHFLHHQITRWFRLIRWNRLLSLCFEDCISHAHLRVSALYFLVREFHSLISHVFCFCFGSLFLFLFSPVSLAGFMNRIGCVWLLIGALRYQLLICCTDLDPTAKYCLKYSRVMEKISSLQLETQVRDIFSSAWSSRIHPYLSVLELSACTLP